MNTRQLAALVTLAFAGTAAMADDITVVADHFVAQKTRAEVRAEVQAARAAGVAYAPTEAGTAAPQAAASTVTRDQVRAELRNRARPGVVVFNEAA